MKTNFTIRRSALASTLGAVLVSATLLPVVLHGQGAKRKNPASKVFVSDVNGEAQIDTGEKVEDLSKRSVYNAQGTIIETKKAETEGDKGKIYSTMVYSNGTGAYFDHDTRVEVKRFVQEPFTPNRADMDVEPSISQTQAFVARGAVGLCTSKLVAGSTMTYHTPLGAVNIRGKKVVIEANDRQTKISMLEGDSTVRGGTTDLGGQVLHAGEQAIITPGTAGGPNLVQISRIPPNEVGALDDKVAMACMAKKTVYFEVKERTIAPDPAKEEKTAKDDETKKEEEAKKEGEGTTKSVASNRDSDSNEAAGANAFAGGANNDTAVTAFDGPALNSPTINLPGTIIREIVPVEVVPTELPVQFTISPASLITPAPKNG